MNPRYYISCIILLLGIVGICSAQSGFYVPATGKIFFTGDSSTIFSNVTNNGNLGIGKNATLNFKGRIWYNSSQSLITDDSQQGYGTRGQGGWLRFMGDSTRQQIAGGYNAATGSGPSFTKIMIDNARGVELLDGSAKARNEINFRSGHFFLNDYILSVGNNDPGTITGYDSARYFVTGNGMHKGLLLRENIRRHNGRVDFPVGSGPYMYTPAALRNRRAIGDDYYVSVFDSLRSGGSNGIAMTAVSVNKTWQVGKRNTSRPGRIEIALQHLLADEGSFFAANRAYAYVSQYKNNSWDTGYPQQLPANGSIGSGNTYPGSGLNEREFEAFTAGDALFSKLTGNGIAANKTKCWFNAYRLDSSWVKVYWYTKPEYNLQKFVVERMLATEDQFKAVDTLPSLAPNGYSTGRLDYETRDANGFTGVSFYRLRLIAIDNSFSYSDTVAVNGMSGLYSIFLWPNPAPGHFFLSIHKTLPAKAVLIYNAIGQRVAYQEVSGRNILEFDIPVQGTYFVSIVLTNGVFIETKKVVIAGSR